MRFERGDDATGAAFRAKLNALSVLANMTPQPANLWNQPQARLCTLPTGESWSAGTTDSVTDDVNSATCKQMIWHNTDHATTPNNYVESDIDVIVYNEIDADEPSVGDVFYALWNRQSGRWSLVKKGGFITVARHNSSDGSIQWQVNHPTIAAAKTVAIGVSGSSLACVASYTLSDVVVRSPSTGSTSSTIASPLVSAGASRFLTATAVDSSGNIFVGANQLLFPGTANTLWKYNSSGTLQWSINGDFIRDLACDSSGNIYATRTNSAGGNVRLTKWNSSGTWQWDKTPSGLDQKSLFIDGSNNILVACFTGSTTHTIYVYNTSGTNTDTCAITVGFSAAVGWIAANSSTYAYTADKVYSYDRTAKTQNWNASPTSPTHVAIDSSGNVAAISYVSAVSDADSLFWYNSSGVKQWDESTLKLGSTGTDGYLIMESGEPIVSGLRRDRF